MKYKIRIVTKTIKQDYMMEQYRKGARLRKAQSRLQTSTEFNKGRALREHTRVLHIIDNRSGEICRELL